MTVIYKNIEEYNPNKKHKILIIFDDIVAEILNNKNLIAYKLYKSHLIFDHSSDIDFK